MSLQQYLDAAQLILERFGITPGEEKSELAELLTDVADVDEAKIVAIAQTLRYMKGFNELVRDNVKEMSAGTRYEDITDKFTTIREDLAKMVGQIQDGKYSTPEKLRNAWMKLMRGSTKKRFDKICDLFEGVNEDLDEQLDHETAILEGYANVRLAMAEAKVLAAEVKEKQEGTLEDSKGALEAAQKAVDAYTSAEGADKDRLVLDRDKAMMAWQTEDRRYQLLKDVYEQMQVGMSGSQALASRLQQSHGVKTQLYSRGVTFFDTNEIVYTMMSATYTSEQGLHEGTEAMNAMTEGANKALEQLADAGTDLQKKALKAAYGQTISPESIGKLLEAVVSFQTESLELIGTYRKESEAAANQSEQMVQDWAKRSVDAVTKYLQKEG